MQAATDVTREIALGEWAPHPVPVQDRIRRIPEAVLLTAGYYASRVPALTELLRRID